MPHLVGKNFWQERRKCRTPCGTFFLHLACVQRHPPLKKKKGEGLFRIAWAARRLLPGEGWLYTVYLNPVMDHNKTGAQSTAESSRSDLISFAFR